MRAFLEENLSLQIKFGRKECWTKICIKNGLVWALQPKFQAGSSAEKKSDDLISGDPTLG
jgi:hypothetical protein